MRRVQVVLLLLGAVLVPALVSGDEVAKKKYGPPYTCAQYPLMTFSGATLYYADYYPDSCGDSPQAAYIYGTYPWPVTCPNCIQGSFAPGTAALSPLRPFPGLDAPLDPAFSFSLPEGFPCDYGKVQVDPDVPYIAAELPTGPITAKVFMIYLNTTGAATNKPGPFNKLIHVAFETTSAPSPVLVDCSPISPVPAQGVCHAYRATAGSAALQIPLLIFTAKR